MASGDGDAPHARRQADLHPRWPSPTPTAAAPSPAPGDQTSIGSRGGRRCGSDGACQPGGVGAGGAAGRIRHCRAGRGRELTALKRTKRSDLDCSPACRVLDSACSGILGGTNPSPGSRNPGAASQIPRRFLLVPRLGRGREERRIAREEVEWKWEWAWVWGLIWGSRRRGSGLGIRRSGEEVEEEATRKKTRDLTR